MQNDIQTVKFGFGDGVDTKTDPWQVPVGKFLSLENMVYSKSQALTKRNGLASTVIPAVSGNNQVAAFNNGLVSIGGSFQSYSPSTGTWDGNQSFTPATLSVSTLVKNNYDITSIDMAQAANGLQCTVYSAAVTFESPIVNLVLYQIIDSISGQTVVQATMINNALSNVIQGDGPRVYVVGGNFVIIYKTSTTLEYLAIPTANPSATPVTFVIDTGTAGALLIEEGTVVGGTLFQLYSRTDTNLNIAKVASNLSVFTGAIATITNTVASASIYLDAGGTNLWVSYITGPDGGGPSYKLFSSIINQSLTTLATSAFTVISISQENDLTVTCFSATANHSTSFVSYSDLTNYPIFISSTLGFENYVYTGSAITTVTALNQLSLQVNIASKAFVYNGIGYLFVACPSETQPTYFLMNQSGEVISRFAYSKAGVNLLIGQTVPLLASTVTLVGSTVLFPYLVVDVAQPVNASQSIGPFLDIVGSNLLNINLAPTNIPVAQGADNLMVGAGFTWSWDGQYLTEQDFFFYPDTVITGVNAGTGFPAGTYFYQAIYQWSDSQGNVFVSGNSVITPGVVVANSTSVTSITVEVSCLNQTYKTAFPVRINLYRASLNQPLYALVATLINNPSAQFAQYIDTSTDASILGDETIYTNGGVVPDVSPPAFYDFASYDSRMFGISAEDRNLLYFSKSLVEATPVEFSDILTYFVPPVIGTGGNTGPLYAVSPMDDKFILFKAEAIYYIVGSGPDNTGDNSQYSAPQSIASTVGTTNPNSVVLTPVGIMFQSDKGIWLVGRDLSTVYIGAPVEQFNSYVITSANVIPASTRIKFTTNQPGFILVYDYFYQQWSWDTGITGNVINSGCLYRGLLTLSDTTGIVYQETPGIYVDGASTPVEMSFITAWLALDRLQAYQRSFWFISLCRYLTAHSITWSMAYDYQDTIQSSITVVGRNDTPEQERIFLSKQKCQALQIQMQEVLTTAGAGFTMSGINLLCMAKGGWRPMPSVQTVGAP